MYPVILYINGIIKEFFETFTESKKFVFPMIDWRIGMGDDILTTLNYYGYGDPFYLFYALIKEEYLLTWSSVLFYIRVYLGGISFILLMDELLENKKSSLAYVVGGMIYSFSGFTVLSNYQFMFVHAMMYIPLLLLGAQRTLNNKTRGVLTLSVLGFALTGFYYLYIGSIALGIFVIYRLLVSEKEKKVKNIIYKILKVVVEYILGIGLSSVIFIPCILGFFSSNRIAIKQDVSLFRTWREIKVIFLNIFLPGYNYEQALSYVTIEVMIIILTIFAKNRLKEKVSVVILFFSVLIPYISVIMSGFGEEYDRWQIIITIYFSYLAVQLWDDLANISRLQTTALLMIYIILVFVGKEIDILENENFKITLWTYVFLMTLIFVMKILTKLYRNSKDNKNWNMVINMVFFVVVIFTIGKEWRVAARDVEIDSIQEKDVVSELIQDTNDFFRIDNERTRGKNKKVNIALECNYNGIAEYFSIENGYYTAALEKWNISPDFNKIVCMGVDTRGVLETLSAVKYYIKKPETATTIPYGFCKISESSDGEWSLYQNKYNLPIVYSYNNVFDEELYDSMNGFERQQVALQAAAVQGGYNGNNIKKIHQVDNLIKEQFYTIEKVENASLKEQNISFEKNGKIKIKTKLNKNGENYILIEDMPIDVNNSLTVSMGDICKDVNLSIQNHNNDIGINLGTTVEENDEVSIELSFSEPIKFELSNLKILFFDMKNYSNYVEQLRDTGISNISVNKNSIACNTNFDKTKILCVSTPYKKGWSAYVDGIKQDIYCVNDMFIGIEVSVGEHDIELKYETPGIRIGISISVLSFGVILLYFLYKKYKVFKV